MKINWVAANTTILDPTVDLEKIKNIGSIWGGWQTWRGCQTDNVICHSMKKSADLLQRGFNTICNFYIPKDNYSLLDQPQSVCLYEGKFPDDIEQADEIVALHLAAGLSDIVLLLGFDWTERPKLEDRLQEHRAHVYRTLVNGVVRNNPGVQFVAVDHPNEFRTDLAQFENLTRDSMSTALSLLDS
jgi:hypothetical protein